MLSHLSIILNLLACSCTAKCGILSSRLRDANATHEPGRPGLATCPMASGRIRSRHPRTRHLLVLSCSPTSTVVFVEHPRCASLNTPDRRVELECSHKLLVWPFALRAHTGSAPQRSADESATDEEVDLVDLELYVQAAHVLCRLPLALGDSLPLMSVPCTCHA